MKSVLTPLAKNVLLQLRSSAGISAEDAAIQKKFYGSGRPSDLSSRTTALIISNEGMGDIIKIVKSLEESKLIIKGIIETIKNETKEQKGGFISTLLGTLGAKLLGNLLAGRGALRAGKGTIRAYEHFYCRPIL